MDKIIEGEIEQWKPQDFEFSDQNIYIELLKNDKRKIKPGVKEFLIYARNELNLSQGQMAKRIDITQTALSRYENGLRKVPFDVFMEIAEALGYEFVLRLREKKWGSEDLYVKERKEEKEKWKDE